MYYKQIRRSYMSYHDWLNTYIEWDGSLRIRKHCIIDFVKNGLFPFMNRLGYDFNISVNFIQSVIATGLYENRGVPHMESKWDYPNPSGNTEWDTENLQHYYYIVNEDVWYNFWLKWGKWSDVSQDSFRGIDRRYDIQTYVKQCIDVEKSQQSQLLNEALESETDAYIQKNGIDAYIQDYMDTT
jgi:hypothetical protein